MTKKTVVLMTLAFLLAACLPAAQPTADIQSQINTAIAQTMEIDNLVVQNVQQTLTALAPAASPTAQPTSTLEPTFEPVTLITDTPLPVIPITTTEAPLFAGPTATEVKFSCYVTTLKPKPGATANRNQGFDIVWMIVNTGSRPILVGTDFKFSGGINMANTARIEITTTVNTGESFRVELDGTAPNEKGVKYMAWKLTSPVCYGEVYITVK